MGLKVFNTLTRKKEEFVPLNEGKIGIYVCGVTVYDVCHIGHARCYVAFDVIVRYLRFLGFDVTYVRNFTDVDDKIIKRANELNTTIDYLTNKYIKEFYEDMDALGVMKADIEPRVTNHIPQIIETIQRIIENGHAYVTESGDVYYDITSFPEYLKLSGRKLDEMIPAGSERVDAEEIRGKRHPLDFALWKSAKEGEPYWESPWGKGRPGWHIECSTMSSIYLGDVFDLHGGGMDLIFPHHENERAQSWAISGKEFVRYWLHNGFVTVGAEQEKMSKSLKNFFTIKDVIKVFYPEALRYFLLTTHYRSPINFTETSIMEAENRVEYIYETLLSAKQCLFQIPYQPDKMETEKRMERFIDAMNDDFNTANALGVLSEEARKLNEAITMKGKEKGKVVATILKTLENQCNILGICQKDPQEALDLIQRIRINRRHIDCEKVTAMIEERAKARAMKDFITADHIRSKLQEMGILIMDTPQGTKWKVI